MYTLTGVTKEYRMSRQAVRALQGVNLVIEDGEWLAVQGPTGHGKTTLLQMLGGLDRPTGGTVDLDGQDLGSLRAARLSRLRARAIGFVFQTFNLIRTLSPQENVEAALAPLRVPAARRRNGPPARWPASVWPSGPAICRRSCPAGSSSEWRSRGPW